MDVRCAYWSESTEGLAFFRRDNAEEGVLALSRGMLSVETGVIVISCSFYLSSAEFRSFNNCEIASVKSLLTLKNKLSNLLDIETEPEDFVVAKGV